MKIVNSLCGGYVYKYEGVALLLTIFVLLLKVLINQRATALEMKKMLVSIPGDIVFLVIGFLFSDIYEIKGNAENTVAGNIVLALLILIMDYALEKWLNNKLSGNMKIKSIVVIVMMYIVSILFYIGIVWGGVYNE